MRPIKKAAIGCAAATISVAALLWVLPADHPKGDEERDVPLFIGVGETCHSLHDPRYELSCGTTAFGDVRSHCQPGRPETCRRTTAVTLRNVGLVKVQVTSVSGKREGDRQLSRAHSLEPGGEVTVRLRPGDEYFFDILLRSADAGIGAIRVVGVS